MADNTTINAGSGGDTISTDDIGAGVKVQRVKIQTGTDGTATDVSASNPVPVSDNSGSLTVDGLGSVTTTSTSLAKAEDAVHGSGDAGVMALAVRKDTASALAGTDGDYIPLIVNSGGALYVDTGVLEDTVSGTELQVDIVTMPGADRTVDNISAALATDAIMSDTTVLTPKFANIAVASSGANTIVSAVSAKKIRVLACALVASTANNVYFVDGAGSPVPLFGGSTNKVNLAANGGFVLPFNPVGWFETSTTNVNLNLNLSAANAVGGSLVYVEV